MSRHRFVDDAPAWTACVVPHAKDPERPRTAHVGLLCLGHHRSLEQHLAELPALIDDVEAALVRGDNGAGPKVTGTKTPPLPFCEGVSDALRAAHAVLASWCLLVLEEHPDGLHSPASDLRAMSVFLLRHLDWCAAQPWVDDLLRETREQTSALRGALTLSRTRRVPLGPCDATVDQTPCPGILVAVVRTLDEGLPPAITCPACGAAHEPETWRTLARRLRGEEASWLTSAQLSHLLRVPLKTLQRWAVEDDWRFMDCRPRRYHAEDAHQSYNEHRETA